MTTAELIRQLSGQPICRSIELEMQWGIPFFYEEKEKCFVRFWLNRQRFVDEQVILFPPIYRLEFEISSLHLCRYEDLYSLGVSMAQTKKLSFPADEFWPQWQKLQQELFSLGDELLQEGRWKTVLPLYQNQASEGIKAAGCQSLYAAEVDG